MSNCFKNYMHNLRLDFEHNFELALDPLPNGWMKEIIPQLKDELFNALGTYADCIMFHQIKEKFGELTVYWNFPDMEHFSEDDCAELEELVPCIEDIIKKYKDISKNTCVVCGKPATYTTTWGYIAPFCDDCERNRSLF